MLSVIIGKQRGGKSYYCVTLVIEYLQKSDRPIYTNLPLNPDKLCSVACFGKHRHPAVYENYMRRIHLFKSFKGKKRRLDYKYFKMENPDYLAFHKRYNLFVDIDLIRSFWHHTEPNAVILLDELYQWFSSMDTLSRDKDIINMRKELLTYTRQHGHVKDDMFLISHSEKDLDVHIRRGIQRLYLVENAKYKNISDRLFFKGLKWPIQFFIISVYEYGDQKHSDRYIRFSKQEVFSCYESFSMPETLLKKKASKLQKSTDTHIDNKANVMNFLKQTWPFIAIFLFLGISGCRAYSYIKNDLLKASVKVETGGLKSDEKKDLNEYYKVIFISPHSIVFDDNYKLNIGDIIHGYKVKKFKRFYCVLSDDAGNIYKVSYSGLRIREQQQSKNVKQHKQHG